MRRALLGLAMALSVACMDDGVTGSSTVTGAYSLRTVNGSGLPYTIVTNETTTEILDDVITLYQGGTYTWVGHSRITTNGQMTDATNATNGTYSLLGNSVALRDNATQLITPALVNGNTMTIVNSGVTLAYRK